MKKNCIRILTTVVAIIMGNSAYAQDDVTFKPTLKSVNMSNGSKQSGKVKEPNDPPLIGKEQDRVERDVSYVKDFEAIRLGTYK